MVFQTVAAVSALWLVADGKVRITEAQLEAAQYGRILGAAAQCHSIDRARVDAAMHHASLAVRALVSSAQEFETARGSFENAARDGGENVSQGRETCAAAEEELKRIEQKFAGN